MSSLDFGYPWWLSYGHLLLTAIFGGILWIGLRRRWSKWALAPIGLAVVWSIAGFLIVRFMFDVNGSPAMPTENFLRAGSARVLDMGAGTGRSSIMVLTARPQTSMVALDLFGASFEEHFGKNDDPQRRLRENLDAAGVAARTTIQAGDMRKLPFESQSFDAIVSAYAIDHLGRDGASQALQEAARVVKPNGEFLLMVVANESWARFAFGPLLAHGGPRGAGWWTERMQAAGFQILEHGTKPMTLYLLARKAQS